MYRKTITAVVILITILITSVLNAQEVDKTFYSGYANLAYCKGVKFSPDEISNPAATYDHIFRDGYCKGIVEGALRALRFSATTCIPSGVTQGQALLIVVTYMEKHPALLHLDLAALAADALRIAFACRGSGDPTR
jgi:hypothetical protein